jgi:AcrR family transcriptional regulator
VSSGPSRPRGRRPGSSGTREAILAAARERFAAHGYDRTRVRDVARDAGVDAALVHYFFKSKDGLFVAAMELPLRPAEVIVPILVEGVDGLGERLVRRLLAVWDENRPALLAIVQSATGHPGAAFALREFVLTEIVGRIAGTLGGADAELRANLVASQVVGLIAARYLARAEPLASLDREAVVPLVAPTLQRYLDGDLRASPSA